MTLESGHARPVAARAKQGTWPDIVPQRELIVDHLVHISEFPPIPLEEIELTDAEAENAWRGTQIG
ncbi:hypothetical protein [Saccharothrix texasensis]|uniref:hypothetical protein n=1 Tax=Saccharothrix texasensis TaxID=103734 RepID=UPI0011CE6114|nr:hypothetical protein [Saccharothrix texasensis]